MKIFKSLFLLGLFLFLWNSTYAYFNISNYAVRWDIKIDWTIDINEKIDTYFDSEMHWIERILEKYYSVENTEFQVFYNDINVKWDNFTTYNDYWDTVIRIGDANKTVYWAHNYNIDYSMYWVILNFIGILFDISEMWILKVLI